MGLKRLTRKTLWDADHRIPVSEGGGECDLDNLRTLCLICHRVETAAQRRRRALSPPRTHEAAGGKGPPDEQGATLYESLGGTRYLRLTDFTTSNGPDVHVVLARAEAPALDQKVVKGNLDYVELGKLKGNQGIRIMRSR